MEEEAFDRQFPGVTSPAILPYLNGLMVDMTFLLFVGVVQSYATVTSHSTRGETASRENRVEMFPHFNLLVFVNVESTVRALHRSIERLAATYKFL